MPGSLAATLALVLTIAVLSPVAWFAWRKSGSAGPIAFLMAALASCWLLVGVIPQVDIPSRAMVARIAAPTEAGQCRTIDEALEGSGLRVDLSNQNAPEVVGNGADALPSEVREALIACARLKSR